MVWFFARNGEVSLYYNTIFMLFHDSRCKTPCGSNWEMVALPETHSFTQFGLKWIAGNISLSKAIRIQQTWRAEGTGSVQCKHCLCLRLFKTVKKKKTNTNTNFRVKDFHFWLSLFSSSYTILVTSHTKQISKNYSSATDFC